MMIRRRFDGFDDIFEHDYAGPTTTVPSQIRHAITSSSSIPTPRSANTSLTSTGRVIRHPVRLSSLEPTPTLLWIISYFDYLTIMTTSSMNQIQSELDRTDARTVLVRGASAPPRPTRTVTVAPGVAARATPNRRHAPLFVSAEAPSGRTIRRYDGDDAEAAADCAVELAAERDLQAVWLCGREQVRSWWGEGVAQLLEGRLTSGAERADARLVVFSKRDGAVGDRYDVVFDP